MSNERLVVNAEPLKTVRAKAGDAPSGEEQFLLARRWRGDYLKAASIHRVGCKVAPEDGHKLQDGTVWHVEEIPRGKVDSAVAWSADKGIEARACVVRFVPRMERHVMFQRQPRRHGEVESFNKAWDEAVDAQKESRYA